MRNINIKLSVSERSEDLIKIAAMQFFFAEMPNRSSTFGYTQFKIGNYLTLWRIRKFLFPVLNIAI